MQRKYKLIIKPNIHIFVGSGPNTLFYTVFRKRKGEIWNHYQLNILDHGSRKSRRLHSDKSFRKRNIKFAARPTVILFEISHWETVGTPKESKRINIKSYIRLKASAGGKEIK